MMDQRFGLPLPRKQYLVWVGVLYIAEIVWSMIVMPFFSINSVIILSVPLLFSAVIALAFGLNHSVQEHTLIPWYLLVAGFPTFAMHVALYIFHFPSPSWLNQVSNSVLFRTFLVWEILGAVYLFAASYASRERAMTMIGCLALYLLAAYGSLVLEFMTVLSILGG